MQVGDRIVKAGQRRTFRKTRRAFIGDISRSGKGETANDLRAGETRMLLPLYMVMCVRVVDFSNLGYNANACLRETTISTDIHHFALPSLRA